MSDISRYLYLLYYGLLSALLSGCINPALFADIKKQSLPDNFVYLKNIDNSIQQNMRYATYHNFIGRPITGYESGECILTRPAALALSSAQKALKLFGFSLMVYDCYRPQMAVDDFFSWSQKPRETQMRAEFYPRVNKKNLFHKGYIAAKSGHTRGSTVDLTIVPLSPFYSERYSPEKKPVSCFAPFSQRFYDGSIDMGTGFDCLDPLAHDDATNITPVALQNRQFLKNIMEKAGFVPYDNEWWHFTLKSEPYPDTYFNFPVK